MKRILVYILLLTIYGSACSDILIPNISKEEVLLVLPPDDLETKDMQHTFRWDFLADATSYNLSIVSPSFETIQQILLDSTTVDNQMVLTLPPGNYEWNVLAFNEAWSSLVSETRTLEISKETMSSLKQPNLLRPINGDTLQWQILNPDLEWSSTTNAVEYALFVFKDLQQDSLVLETRIIETQFDLEESALALTEGTYYWQVIAIGTNGAISIPSQLEQFYLKE